ncbi:CapA family protein [Streptomyces sp. NPDC001941]|uniref:CapA family protein n=1 Tax=Streptomyces sp. NPDC001941 TaxID=3154659 RepID=UPI00332E0538
MIRRPVALSAGLAALLLASGCSTGAGSAQDAAAPLGAASAAPGRAAATPSASPSPARALPPGTITLAFAGDVHFTGRTAVRITPPDGQTALGPASRVLGAADFAMVNLESAITTRGSKQAKIYHFRTPPAALDALKDSGVDAVSMANNHSVDYGPEGLRDTLDAAHDSPVPVVGIGEDDREAYEPYVTEIRGVKLAVVAASQVQDLTNAQWRAGPDKPGIASALNPAKLLKAVRKARAKADVVVVYLHWGTEGRKCPGADQTGLARELARAGATAVVGTHAHVMLGTGMLGKTYVAYGLGNFLWYGTSPYPNSDDSGIATLTIRQGKVTGEEFTPALVDGRGLPQPQEGPAAARIEERMDALRQCSGLRRAPRA